MYISVDKMLANGIPLGSVKVYLDGVEQLYCLEADEDDGWVRLVMRDDAGLILTKGRGTKMRPRTKVYHGDVRIEWVKPAKRTAKEKIDELVGAE